MNISFIGYGNMARAIAKSLQLTPHSLQAASPSLPVGINTEGVATHFDNLSVLPGSEILILGVKPTQVAPVLKQIKQAIPQDCLLISLAAGVDLSWLAKHCSEKQAIVRSMPNIPIAVKQGATPLIANAWVSKKQREAAAEIFQRSGIVTWITKEEDMDVFTALSGSGPAYVLLFLEALNHAAEQLGLSKELAQTFSLQTLRGALELASESSLEWSELRKQVTSPKGTTAAAIQVLQEESFENLLYKAMRAAWLRAKELGIEITL